jgi:hypothetical protein
MPRKSGWPEWIIAPILAILFFLMGFVIGTSPNTGGYTKQESANGTHDTSDYYYPYYRVRDWFAKDAAGFFTFLLFMVASGQAVLFYVQLRLMREGIEDAKIVAGATDRNTRAAIALQLPHIRIEPQPLSLGTSLRVGFESHEARAMRRTRSMTDAA